MLIRVPSDVTSVFIIFLVTACPTYDALHCVQRVLWTTSE